METTVSLWPQHSFRSHEGIILLRVETRKTYPPPTMIPLHRTFAGVTACGLITILTGCSTTDSFNRLDANHDGSCTPTEFENHMKEQVFACIDTNSDARITWQEWQQFNPEVTRAKFQRTDLNRNQTISRKEADAAFDREGTLKEMFALIDSNKNNEISHAELATFHAKVRQQYAPTPSRKTTPASKRL